MSTIPSTTPTPPTPSTPAQIFAATQAAAEQSINTLVTSLKGDASAAAAWMSAFLANRQAEFLALITDATQNPNNAGIDLSIVGGDIAAGLADQVWATELALNQQLSAFVTAIVQAAMTAAVQLAAAMASAA
jgi:hypothetical protein